MKILHVSDTHLGYSAYRKVADHGLNQRELDVYDSFARFIDYALEVMPDIIIHSGDLFDSVRPTNRAITFALTQLLRISRAKIPFVVISGNHETPKLRETGNVFRIFEHLDHIYPIYKGEYETLDFTDIKLHCIPQTSNGEQLKEALGQVTIDPRMRNILILHVGVLGMKEFRMGDFNEHIIPKTVLPRDMDYIALGHYHGAIQVTENTFYAGSTERLSFKEETETKGFWMITFNETRDMQFIPLDTRNMSTLELDCSTMSPQDTIDHITALLKECHPSGKILRFFLHGIPRPVYNTLDFESLEDITREATHFELLPEFPEDENIVQAGGAIGNLMEEWQVFLDQVSLERGKEEMSKLAIQYLSQVEQ